MFPSVRSPVLNRKLCNRLLPRLAKSISVNYIPKSNRLLPHETVEGRRSFSNAISTSSATVFSSKTLQLKNSSSTLKKVSRGQCPFEWIKSLPGFAGLKRQEALRFGTVTFPRRLDRDDAMKACYARFDELLQLHQRRNDLAFAARIPIIGVSAAAGTGKTFFLDEVGALRPADVDQFCKSEKWRPAFKSALVINVTFDSFSGIVDSESDRGSLGLCTRVLYSYFQSILPNRMTFSTFFRHCSSMDRTELNLGHCIEFIANHFASDTPTSASTSAVAVASKEPLIVLLLVDEVSKSKCEDNIVSLVSATLDSSPALADGRACLLLPVFTSLARYQFASACLTNLQRAVLPISLSAPLKSAPAAMKQMLKLPISVDPLIDVLCRDVGYHGRMLQAIAELLAPGTDCRREVMNHLESPFHSLKTIHNAFQQHKLSKSYFLFLGQESLTQAVCAALLGLSVDRSAAISPRTPHHPDSIAHWTFENLESRGVFVDAGDSEDQITPVMSPLQLDYWAKRQLSRPENVDDPIKMKFFSMISRTFSSEAFYNWQTFERFHCDVEILRRFAYLFYGIKKCSLQTFYRIGGEKSRALSTTPAVSLSTGMNFESDMTKNPSFATVKYTDIGSAAASQALKSCIVELAADSQLFYDIRIIQPMVDSTIPLSIFLQCKWSAEPEQPDSEVRKWLAVAKEFETNPNMVFVYVAARYLSNLQNKELVHTGNVILLDQTALDRFYGPTLMLSHAMSATAARFEKSSKTDVRP